MTIDEQTLMAFADGELSGAERARVEAALAADPALAERVERMRKTRDALKRVYGPVVDEPVPDRLLALLADPAPAAAENVTDFVAARERRKQRLGGPPAWAAMAASLVLGVIVGRGVVPDAGLFEGEGGELYAGAALTRALNTQLSSDEARALRVGITFRSQDGDYCRTFTQSADETAVSGLACRDDARWAVRIAVQEQAVAGGYRQAAAVAPAVLDAVDAMIEGEPLDADAERAARDADWRE